MFHMLIASAATLMVVSLNAYQAGDSPVIDGPVVRVFENRERQYVQFVVTPSVWRRGDWVEAMVYSYNGEESVGPGADILGSGRRFSRERLRHNCVSGRTEDLGTEYLAWEERRWAAHPFGSFHNLPHAGPTSADRVVGALLCDPQRMAHLPSYPTIGAAYGAMDIEFGNAPAR